LSIHLFDVVFVIIIVSFSLLSYLRGAMREILSLIGLVGGFMAATRYTQALAAQLNPLLQDEKSAELLAFVLIMMLGYFLGAFLAGFGDLFRRSPEGVLSQVVGGLVGFAKGVTVALALLWVVRVYIPAFQDEMADSVIGSWLGSLLSYLQRIRLV
jgi:membrane protein required for colicin V production